MASQLPDIEREAPFIAAVRRNCDMADADAAAIFSVCGMALRLRDLNKWEKGLAPWQENQAQDLIDWIDGKEQVWESFEKRAFYPLPLDGKEYDPFDTVGINTILDPLGWFYGAGLAHSLKPTFFLARIIGREVIRQTPVITLGRERLRDLLTIPALNQDGAVILRQDAARLFLWDQMAYIKPSGKRFLRFSLRQCGLPDDSPQSRQDHFDSILQRQIPTYIHHEIGEIKEGFFDHQTFRQLVSQYPHTTVELLARTLRDLLADTGEAGPLAAMIQARDTAALGFYAAFQDGLFRPLFPELRPAVEKFIAQKHRNKETWNGIEQTRQTGFNRARQIAGKLMALFEAGQRSGDYDRAEKEINDQLVGPLTS